MILTSWHSGSSLLGSGGELDVLANSFLHTIFSLVFKENREVVDLVTGIVILITNM